MTNFALALTLNSRLRVPTIDKEFKLEFLAVLVRQSGQPVQQKPPFRLLRGEAQCPFVGGAGSAT